MTPEDRAALREAAGKATPEPLIWDGKNGRMQAIVATPEGWARISALLDAADERDRLEATINQLFKEHTDMIAERDRLRAENERLRAVLSYAQQQWHHMIGTDIPAAHHQINATLLAALEATP